MAGNVNNDTFYVSAGMTVEHVISNGTQEQKDAIRLFDWNGDGVISRSEAKAFNSYSITNAGGRGQLTLRHNDNNKGAIVIDYDNTVFKSLECCKVNKNGVRMVNRLYLEGEKWEILHVNLPKNEVTVKGLAEAGVWQQPAVHAYDFDKLNILDSSLKGVNADGVKNINIRNTANKGALYDSKTNLYMDKQANLNADAESKLDVEY